MHAMLFGLTKRITRNISDQRPEVGYILFGYFCFLNFRATQS